MNFFEYIIKLLISNLFLLLLYACNYSNSEQPAYNFSIKDAFGYELGSIPEGLPNDYLNKTQAFKTSTPPKPDPVFLFYTYHTTPKTHYIYGVTAHSRYQFSKHECETVKQLFKQRYIDEFDKKPNIKHSDIDEKWILREHNVRSVSVFCESGVDANLQSSSEENYRVEVSFFDKDLGALGYKEWLDHQKNASTSVN